MHKLLKLNIIASCVFTTLFLALLLWVELDFNPNSNAIVTAVYDGIRLDSTNVGIKMQRDFGRYSLITLCLVFVVITALSHIAYSKLGHRYVDIAVGHGGNFLRWIEYCISATIMMVIIGFSSGIILSSELLTILVGTSLLMCLGFTVERTIRKQSKDQIQLYTLLCCSWVLFGLIWFFVTKSFLRATSINTLPTFVLVIFYSMFFLYASFGVWQTIEAVTSMNPLTAEIGYCILSLVSKMLLSILLTSGIVQRSKVEPTST